MGTRRILTRAVKLLNRSFGQHAASTSCGSVCRSQIHRFQALPTSQSRCRNPLSLTRTWASAADSVVVDEQIETVPSLEDAATGAETPESSVPAASNTGAEEPKIFDPVVQEFTQLYDELNTKLKELGFFEDRPEYTVSNSSRTELGIEKRALLTMSRERVDIVYSLPADKLAHLALQELPYIDRKTKNARERLSSTFVEGHPASDGFGADASTQDLARLVLAAHIACDRDVKKSNAIVSEEDAQALAPAFLKAVSAIIPDLMDCLAAAPDAAALEKADAAEAAKSARHEAMAATHSVQGNRERRGAFSTGRNSGQDIRPGDWLCESCNAVNFANRTECFKCYEPRPESAGVPIPRQRGGMPSDSKPGDWPCPSCGANNFARRSECFRCNEPRPAHIPPPANFRSATPEPREGDWACPDCGVSNFAYRGECFRCQAPRPGGPPPRRQGGSRGSFGGQFDSDRPKPEMRPGDWMCPDCSAHNFASKVVCYRCNYPRPESAGPPIDRRAGRGGFGDGGGRSRGSNEGWTSGNESSGGYGASRPEPADLEW
ncbi:hypothetical protein CVIRNUC_001354 [Coccomyxa viridis]|uniref:RanBP2-type domain-containing protein n=1 Tax=Coccomyxa viridis TaxID=1274662 RepID=A0AAV1HVP9_9CHLO|nr:hypothetical protein CVIRNUC_001354 [Coccomyxa viridis]